MASQPLYTCDLISAGMIWLDHARAKASTMNHREHNWTRKEHMIKGCKIEPKRKAKRATNTHP
eukprot:14653308-Alexandrium_andersonii.AAC.1